MELPTTIGEILLFRTILVVGDKVVPVSSSTECVPVMSNWICLLGDRGGVSSSDGYGFSKLSASVESPGDNLVRLELLVEFRILAAERRRERRFVPIENTSPQCKWKERMCNSCQCKLL